MKRPARHPLIAGTIVTSLGTSVSRVLGLLRDMATAWLLGLGGVADAFWFAFRIPNLFRQLFGEGAMMASSLPVLTGHLEDDPRRARQLATVVVTLLALVLAGVVAAGELVCGAVWLVWGDAPGVGLLTGLSAVLLPYLLLICVAAQLSTILYSARHFTVPAFTPTVLNVVWLAAAWAAARWWSGDQAAQAYVLASSVLVAGVIQVLVQAPTLRRLGFHFEFDWAAAKRGVAQIGRNLAPTLFGTAVSQLNTFIDSLLAWGLAAAKDGPQTIAWLGHAVRYPMQEGAVAAISFGDRFSELPFALIGVAVSVAIFPLLSRHAARGDHRQLGADLTLGMRLVTCLAVPAGAGLFLLAVPISRLLLEHGNFGPSDTIRAARMIAFYATGTWAYCQAGVVVRAFYALGDFRTPARVALAVVTINLTLNLTLIWPMAEAGLAISTSASAGVQVLALTAILAMRRVAFDWRGLLGTIARSCAATAIMIGVVCAVLAYLSADAGLLHEITRVAVPVALGLLSYAAVYRLLGGRELGMLMGRRTLD